MNMTIETALHELTATLDQCEAAWTEATRTGLPGLLPEYLAGGFTGTGGHPRQDVPDSYGLAEATGALPGLLGYVKGGSHTVHNRYVRMRSEEEGVVSFEQCFERDGKVLLRFLYLQAWRKIDGRWLLVRELLEQLAS